MSRNEVKVVISGDASKLGEALGQSEQQLTTFSQRADAMGAKLQQAGAAATLGVTVPLVAMAATSVRAFMEAEKAQAQLEASLASTGATAWTSADQIDALASSMQDKLAVDGDLVKSGAAVLLTFTNVRNAAGEGNDVFDQATVLAADLSAKLGTDLTSANMLLGKALNDPITGMTQLRRAGVQLTEAQQEQVRAFVATGDVMSAQKVILGELETQFGGSAEAFANTAAGQMEKARLQFEDVQEEIGEKLIPTLSKLGEFVSGALDGWDRLGDSGQNVVLVLAGVAAAAGPVSTVVGSVMRLGEQLGGLKDRFIETSTAGDRTTTSLTRAGTAAAGLGGVLAGIAALQIASTINDSTRDLDRFSNTVDNLRFDGTARDFELLGDAIDQANGNIDRIQNRWLDWSGIVGTVDLGGGVVRPITEIERALDSMIDNGQFEQATALLDALQGSLDRGATNQNFATRNQFKDLSEEVIPDYREQLSLAQSAQDEAATGADQLGAAAGELGGTVGATAANFDSVVAALDASAASMELWRSGANGAAEAGKSFADTMEWSVQLDDQISNASKLGAVMRGFGESIQNLPDDIDQTKLALGGYNAEQQASIDALVAAGEANTAYLSGLLSQGVSAQDVAGKADLLRQEYLKQADQLGLNDEQTQRYLETLGLTPEKVETAIMLSKVAEAEFKIRAYQGIINATPPQKLTEFNAAIARGDYIAAAAALDELARPRRVSIRPFIEGGVAGLPIFNLPGRATGGPVSAGSAYIVGEQGPELIIPDSDGVVIPAAQTAALANWAETGRRFGGPAGDNLAGRAGALTGSRSASPAMVAAPVQSTQVLEVHFHGPVAQDSADWVAKSLETAVANGTRLPRTAAAIRGVAG